MSVNEYAYVPKNFNRISGSKVDLEKLKKTFETNPTGAEQLIKVN